MASRRKKIGYSIAGILSLIASTVIYYSIGVGITKNDTVTQTPAAGDVIHGVDTDDRPWFRDSAGVYHRIDRIEDDDRNTMWETENIANEDKLRGTIAGILEILVEATGVTVTNDVASDTLTTGGGFSSTGFSVDTLGNVSTNGVVAIDHAALGVDVLDVTIATDQVFTLKAELDKETNLTLSSDDDTTFNLYSDINIGNHHGSVQLDDSGNFVITGDQGDMTLDFFSDFHLATGVTTHLTVSGGNFDFQDGDLTTTGTLNADGAATFGGLTVTDIAAAQTNIVIQNTNAVKQLVRMTFKNSATPGNDVWWQNNSGGLELGLNTNPAYTLKFASGAGDEMMLFSSTGIEFNVDKSDDDLTWNSDTTDDIFKLDATLETMSFGGTDHVWTADGDYSMTGVLTIDYPTLNMDFLVLKNTGTQILGLRSDPSRNTVLSLSGDRNVTINFTADTDGTPKTGSFTQNEAGDMTLRTTQAGINLDYFDTMRIRRGVSQTKVLVFDVNGNADFQAGNITTTGDLTCQDATVNGKLTVVGSIDPDSIEFTEQASVPYTPSAGKAGLYVNDDAPNNLIYVDDTATEFDMSVASNVVIVNSLGDLPAAVDLADGHGVAHHLAAKAYVFGADISISSPLVPTTTLGKTTDILSLTPITITYTSTGAMIRADGGNGSLTTNRVDFVITNPAASFFDIDDIERVALFQATFKDGLMGTIDADAVILTNVTFDDFLGRLTLEDCDIVYGTAIALLTSPAIGDAFIGFNGTFVSIVMNDVQVIPLATDSGFDIDSGFAGRIELNTINVVVAAGGDVFESTSLDQTDPKVRVHASPNIPDSRTSGGMYVRSNASQTTITEIGLTLPFTAVADAGAGQLTLTMASTTGLSNGQTVWLPNTEYAGTYTLANVIVDTSVEITATFGATASADLHTGWKKVVGTTIADSNNERCTMTGDNVLEFDNIESETLTCTVAYSAESSSASSSTFEFCFMVDDDIVDGSIVERDMINTTVQGMMLGTVEVVDGEEVTIYARNMTIATRHPIFKASSTVVK